MKNSECLTQASSSMITGHNIKRRPQHRGAVTQYSCVNIGSSYMVDMTKELDYPTRHHQQLAVSEVAGSHIGPEITAQLA